MLRGRVTMVANDIPEGVYAFEGLVQLGRELMESESEPAARLFAHLLLSPSRSPEDTPDAAARSGPRARPLRRAAAA